MATTLTMTTAASSCKSYYTCLSLCILLVHLVPQHSAVASSFSAFVPSTARSHNVVIASPYSTTRRQHDGITSYSKSSIILSATEQNTEKGPSARERGIYSRPSAAIERGSGFFIPGLEGSRIRFIFGITVLLADAANHVLVGGRPGDWGQGVAEVVSAFYGALLLLQGSIELGVERGVGQQGVGASDDEGSVSGTDEDGVTPTRPGGSGSKISESLQGNELDSIQRMARTIITFTPATCFQFVSENSGVLYSSGVGNDGVTTSLDADEQKRLIQLSLDAVSGSKGGRVALPSEHPASKLLPEVATRCILVQRVDEGYQGSKACMIIGSDKLLPSFTKNDLRWIGQLAQYNDLMGKAS